MGPTNLTENEVKSSNPSNVDSTDVDEDSPSGAVSTDGDLYKYSLFGNQNEVEYPMDIDNEFLSDMGRPFQAVWFTYDDRDVCPTRPVEECAETLQVGVVRAALSPDVVHRLELYLLSLNTSLEATPLASKGE